jgi:hypothetical protein
MTSPANRRFDATYLHSVLDYDPTTGDFHWKTDKSQSAWAGQLAGGVNQGHVMITIDGHLYKAADLAWLYVEGKWPEFKIIHKDGDNSDDSWDNLKLAPQLVRQT